MTVTADALDIPQPETADAPVADRFVEEALRQDKTEGMRFGVKARWIALAVIAVLLPFTNPRIEVLYYEAILVCFALIGWLQLRIGRPGRSRAEFALMVCDLALMTFTIIVPNPLREDAWPLAMQYRFENFIYFFVLLAFATLAYSWRTLIAMGTWVTLLWGGALLWVLLWPIEMPELSQAVAAALGDDVRMAKLLDPNDPMITHRIQELVVFLLVAGTLALGGWRTRRLLNRQAATERERANLARYFSPNVVEELSHNDEPLKQTRSQDVAVLFVDIVGFTSLAETRGAQETIALLRVFHGRMEREVFAHGGTLDKYLGDGLMATFGTPYATASDAGNALRCARAMLASVEAWNAERRARGEPPVQASFGLHYGDAVLGNIGASRLEFAVIGNTVNVASRLETLTRALGTSLVASEALVARARAEPDATDVDFDGLVQIAPQPIRGVADPLSVWTLSAKR